MPVLILDTFTDANGTKLQDHTPEIGGSWFQTESFRDTIIEDNHIEAAPPSLGGDRYLNDFTIPDDGIVSADFTPGEGGCELSCRATSITDGYFLKINATNLQLFIRTAGGTSLLKTEFGLDPLPGNIALKFEGNVLQGFIDDVLSIEATDSTYPSGLVGVYVTGFRTGDNFMLEAEVPCLSLVPPPPASWFDVLSAIRGDAKVSLMIRTVDLSNGAFTFVVEEVDFFG